MNVNPLSLLADVIPAKGRKYVYAVVATALFVYSVWEASNGDIRTFLVSLASTLVVALAAANTPAAPAEVADAAVELIEKTEADLADERTDLDRYLDEQS